MAAEPSAFDCVFLVWEWSTERPINDPKGVSAGSLGSVSLTRDT